MQLSANPSTFKYGYDTQVSIKGGIVYTTDGATFYNSTLLASAKDVSLNRDQLLLLTDNIKISDCAAADSFGTSVNYTNVTLITDSSGYYLYAVDPTSITGTTLSLTSNLLSATVFNLSYAYTSAGSLSSVNVYYTVTQNGVLYNLYLTAYSSLLSSTLTSFSYTPILSSESISLINPVDNNFVSSTGLGGTLVPYTVLPTSFNVITIPNNCIFKLLRFRTTNAYGNTQKSLASGLVKYTPISNDLSITSSVNEAPFNYLVTTPYKMVTDVTNININTLKNYYDPTHIQTTDFNTQLRTYNRIYTGLNQNEGYDKIYLGYNSAVFNLLLTIDTDNYFHYPYGTNILPLSSSSLISYGSYSNTSPYRSDRIFKRAANYKNYGSWGDSTTPTQRGKYFCSWLSAGANPSISPVWVDRYYDPRISNLIGINLYSAGVSALSGVLTNSTNNYPNLIWDTPTTLTFEPGVLYYYHRIGKVDNSTLVQSFSGLTYYINNWGPSLVNNVTGLTAGQITSFTVSNSATSTSVVDPYYIIGNTYGSINTNESDFKNNNGNTLSFFAYKDNWTNIIGDQILGNYFNGGLGVFNNNPIITPYFSVTSALSTVSTFNTNLELINYETINTLVSSSSDLLSGYSFTVKGTYDGSYYVVDNYPNNKFITTFDADDLITYKTPLTAFSSTITNEIMLEAVLRRDPATSIDTIIVKTRNTPTTCCYRKFLTNGILVSEVSATGFNNFVIDLSGNPQYYNSKFVSRTTLSGSNACVDSKNNVYALSGTFTSDVVLRNGVGILSLSNPEYINCDQDDNIWITMNNKHLVKTNNRGDVIWLKQVNTDEAIINNRGHRVINFIAEMTTTGVVYYGLLLDGSSQYIYKIDMNGNTVAKISVPGLIPNGDSTGFDYQRKFIKPVISTPGLSVKLVTRDSTRSSGTPKYTTLNTSTSGFAPGWHHFAVTYDHTDVAKFYVDGNIVVQNTNTIPTGRVLNRIYNYKNNPQLTIGTSSFKTTTLNQWINRPLTYLFNGAIADIRLYNITLSDSDIRALTKRYRHNQFSNLSWVIPTGTKAYIEEIERFFLHRMPGNKSHFYNIHIRNSGIQDVNVRQIVENNIRNATLNVAPAHTELSSIIWE